MTVSRQLAHLRCLEISESHAWLARNPDRTRARPAAAFPLPPRQVTRPSESEARAALATMRLGRAACSSLCALLVFAALGKGQVAAESVWLVSNGFHTSIAVRLSEAPCALAALSGDPRADHLLFGWGAAIYYTAGKVTPAVFCRATFTPTASALHIVPVRGPLHRRFPHSDIIRCEVPAERFNRLAHFLRDAVRHRDGRPVLIGPGYFEGSRFYAGRHIFWFPVTCNIWSARALREAGLPVTVCTAVAAPNLVWQAARHGRREQWRRRPVDTF